MVRSAGEQVPFPSVPPIARKRATRYVQADWHELADHYSSPLSPSPALACRRVSSSVWRALKCPGALPDGFPSLHRLLNPPNDFLFCLVASHHHQMNSAFQLRGGHGTHFPLPTNAYVPPALMDITVMHRAHTIKTSWIKYSKIKCSSRAQPYNKLGFQFSVPLLLIYLSVFFRGLAARFIIHTPPQPQSTEGSVNASKPGSWHTSPCFPKPIPLQVGWTLLIPGKLSHTDAKRNPPRLKNIRVHYFTQIPLQMISLTLRFIKMGISRFYSFKFCLHSLCCLFRVLPLSLCLGKEGWTALFHFCLVCPLQPLVCSLLQTSRELLV